MLGVEEVVLIFVIVLIVFGPDKLPDVARMLGRATREFRKITSTAQRTWDEVTREMELKETQEKARQREENQRAGDGAGAPEGQGAGSEALPKAQSAPALEEAVSKQDDIQDEAEDTRHVAGNGATGREAPSGTPDVPRRSGHIGL